jgi:purine/pyrimidine-nucleoside phosphorylase
MCEPHRNVAKWHAQHHRRDFTAAPELMEINLGKCKVRLNGETEWKTYSAGEKFTVPGNSSFDIEVTEMLDYVCHFE